MNRIIIRNKVIKFFYQNLLKPVYFLMDPELVHDRMLAFGRFLGRTSMLRSLVSAFFGYSNPQLEQEILGIKFKNPVGLAAGFDKNAMLVDILPSVGFGFMEVGSITGEPCQGNPKPRLWRLKQSKSLVVYYGLSNYGSEAISAKLAGKTFDIPLGTNVAKTNIKATDDIAVGVADYAKAFKKLAVIGDYFTVNISCPNTSGGEPFLEAENLEKLFVELDKIETKKPVFVKLSPDISDIELDGIIQVCKNHRVHGFICSNLTKRRDNSKILDRAVPPKGGFGGKIVEELANQLVKKVYQKSEGRFVIIGCGGVFTAEDAYKKIKLGANLIQLITGMIYGGPQTISEINQGLVELLKKDGYKSIPEAVGVENRVLQKVA